VIANHSIDRIAKIKHLYLDNENGPNFYFFSQLFPSLESLRLRDDFDQPINKGMLPRTLRRIEFGLEFNFHQEIVLPESLEELILGDDFNQSMVLPRSLTKLKYGNQFDNSFHLEHEKSMLPENLSDLELGMYFNEKIPQGFLPQSLKRLKFGFCFNQQIEKDVLPNGLTDLVFGFHFNQQIPINVLPGSGSLTDLEFDFNFNQLVKLPANLRNLRFGARYNQPINRGFLPESLRNLRFGRLFNQKLVGCLPKKLEILGLSWYYGFCADDFVSQGFEDLCVHEFNDSGKLVKITRIRDGLIHIVMD